MDPETITPLTEQLNSFPHFMPNQVLTHAQLNQLAFYLEQQDRFTRQRLIGIGVVCGLQTNLVVSGAAFAVEVSRGVGVTSCGFLVDVPQKLTFNKRRNYTTPADYDPFLLGSGAGTPIDCLELKPADTTEGDVVNIQSGDVINKVVVAFLDVEDKPNGKCLGENCDEKGNKWLFTLRFLLIGIDTMNAVLKKTYSPNPFANPLNSGIQREEYFNPEYLLPTVFVERFGNTTNNVNTDFNLSSIDSFAEFEDTYINIIEKSSIRIGKALHETYRLFKPLFDNQLSINATPFAGFNNGTAATNTLTLKLTALLDDTVAGYKKGSCQYIYDFLRDMADTYHSLRDELFALASACSPDPSKFPRHLMLGVLEGTDFWKFDPLVYATPSVYRHHFLSSRILNHQSKHVQKTRMLIERLTMMIDSLEFSDILTDDIEKEPVKILPDKLCCDALDEQHIPFYYGEDGTEKLLRFWNFKYTIQNRPYENRSYFASSYVPGSWPADVKANLISSQLFDISKHAKISIEGHVGKELQEAIDALKDLRKRYNLSFDILALKLSPDFNQVTLAEESLIADLQALYLMERNEIVCCLEELHRFMKENEEVILFLLILIISILLRNNPNADQLIVLFQQYLSTLFASYLAVLEALIKSLPDDVKKFNFQDFIDVYPAVSNFTALFKYGINTWGDIEFFLFERKEPPVAIAVWTLADLISALLNIWELHLDKIGDDCLPGKFYTIYTLMQSRLQTFCLFDRFNEQIHGMEHIAGTVHGGTFILVYEDAEEVKEITGEIVSVKGKPVEEAFIVNAENPAIVYGKTDKKGSYKIQIPAGESTIKIMKPGHVAFDLKVEGKAMKTKGSKSQLLTYCDAAAAKKFSVKNMRPADKAFVDIKKSYDAIIGADKAFAKFEDFINADMNIKVEDQFVIESKPSYRVVADFYLPHLINNYAIQVNPLDACEALGETKIIDFTAVTKTLNAQLRATKAGKEAFKNFMGFGGDK